MEKYSTAEEVEVEKLGQVENELNVLGESLERLYSVSESLKSKLKPIIFENQNNEVEDGEDGPEQYLVPIATRIRNFRKSIQAHTEQQAKLLKRIEL